MQVDRRGGERERERERERVRERGRERELRAQAWGSAFIGVEGGVLGVLQAYSLLVDLKHNSRNLKHRKRKQTSSPNSEI